AAERGAAAGSRRGGGAAGPPYGSEGPLRHPCDRGRGAGEGPSEEGVAGDAFEGGEAASPPARRPGPFPRGRLLDEGERDAALRAAHGCHETQARVDGFVVDVADDAFPHEDRAGRRTEARRLERAFELVVEVASVELEGDVDDARRELHTGLGEHAALAIE